MPLATSLYNNLSLYTLLYIPFISKLTKLRTFFNLYILQMYSYSSKSTYLVEYFFLAPKQFIRSRLNISTICDILLVTIDSSTFLSIASSEISLYTLATIQSPLFGFFSSIILVFLYYIGRSPLSNDIQKKSNTLSFTTSYTYFYTIASNLLSPSAFYNFAVKILYSTSFIIRGSINTIVYYSYSPLSSILTSSRGKNTNNSSSAYSILSFIVDLSRLVNSGILLNTKLLYRSKYFTAYYIFVLSIRKSSQYTFFCLQIVLQYSLVALFAYYSRLGNMRLIYY